jgi:hypothetical protein
MIYHHQHVNQMAILDPTYVVPPIIVVHFADNDNPTPMELMKNAFGMATHLHTLQLNQANAMAAFQATMNQAQAPPPVAPPINVQLPQHNARLNPPAAFMGKDSVAAQHFLMEVNTYANIAPFTTPVVQMQWTLLLCEEDTKSW